jgi:2'-5' RNA ligase
MRCFVAIDMPEAVKERLEELQEALPVGRLTDPENLHLTLAFLGDVAQEPLVELNDELSALRLPPFTLALDGLGTFGAKAPTVLWAGVKPDPQLTQLHDKVQGAVRKAGIGMERKRFRPHVTLARFPARLDPVELGRLRHFLELYAAAPLPEVEVEDIVLYESHLRPDGPLHVPLETYPLRMG